MSRALQSLNEEWRKSTRSSGNGACVEVALRAGSIVIRDSKDPSGPVLSFDAQAWRNFVADVQAGELDLP